MIDGNPFPTVSWTFNGTLITNDSVKYIINNTSLIVRGVDRDDAGLYRCTAVNVFGSDTITYDVETYGKVITLMNKICCQNQIKE